MQKLKSLLIALFVVSSFCVEAQSDNSKNHTTDDGGWFEINVQKALKNDWSLSLVHQHRRSEYFERYHHAFWVAEAASKIGEYAKIGGGYVYLHNQPLDVEGISTEIKEHRGFQYFKTGLKLKKVTLTHRLQLEERFLRINTLTTIGERKLSEQDDFALRGRVYFGASLPLSQAMDLVVYEELFLQTDFDNPVFVEQNRAGAYLKYKVCRGLDVKAGYMNWTLYSSGLPKRSVTNHTITTALVIRLN